MPQQQFLITYVGRGFQDVETKVFASSPEGAFKEFRAKHPGFKDAEGDVYVIVSDAFGNSWEAGENKKTGLDFFVPLDVGDIPASMTTEVTRGLIREAVGPTRFDTEEELAREEIEQKQAERFRSPN